MSQWADDLDFKASPGFLASLGIKGDQDADPQFAKDYREHVVPQLINLTKAESFCVHHVVETFSDAHAVVMRHAIELGGYRLGNEILADLEDAILTKLADEIDILEAQRGP